METLIQNVYEFNEARGLINGYDTKKEVALILEEVLELFEANNPKEDARELVEKSFIMKKPIESDRDIIDAYIDIIYISIGALVKKYDTLLPNKDKKRFIIKLIGRAIDNVCMANASKKGHTDESGKYIKSSDFKPPFIPLNIAELFKNDK